MDNIRNKAALLALLNDNITGNISAQDMRDVVVTMYHDMEATGVLGPYLYIAYALDSVGTSFTTTFNSTYNYIAFLNSPTEILTLTQSNFNGLWSKYKNNTSSGTTTLQQVIDNGNITTTSIFFKGVTDGLNKIYLRAIDGNSGIITVYNASGVASTTINGTTGITSVSFIKTGGTSSQFLKADGSIDSTVYQTVSSNGLLNILGVNPSTGGIPITSPDGLNSITLDNTGLTLSANTIMSSLNGIGYITNNDNESSLAYVISFGNQNLITASEANLANNRYIQNSSFANTLKHNVKNFLNSPKNEVSQNATTALGIVTLQQLNSGLGNYAPLSGATMTGPLILNADATIGLQAVTYQQFTNAIVGVYKLQGGYNASSNLFPSASNTTNPISATIKRGMIWNVTVAGVLGGQSVSVGDELVALIDNPLQLAANWNIVSHDIGYVPLSNVLNSSNIFVGNSSNIASAVTMSGDASISNTGILTLSTITQSSTGSFVKINLDIKGRVIGNTIVVASDIISLLGSTYQPFITAGTTSQYYRGDKTFQTLDTLTVAENTNLYFTNSRAISSVLTGYVSGAGIISATDSILSAIQKLNGNISTFVTGVSSVFGRTGTVVAVSGDYTTTLVTEGTNLYYTQTRFDAAFAAKTTTNLAEGINLYFTNARAVSSILTGYISGAGIILTTDSILQAIQKLNGNTALLTGAVIYQGTWDANTNTPTFTSGVGTKGYLYKVSVAGTTTIDGISQWNIGDTIVFDGTTWDKIDGIANEVLSVNGLVGAVLLTGTLNRITISGTNVFDISTSYIGQSSITTLGTITTGVWNGSVINDIYISSATNWNIAYTNRITSLTTIGSSGSATLVTNTLNIPTYTLSGLGGQPLATNLTSLAGLTYLSASFVKMTATGTFALDTNIYLTSNQSITLSGDVTGSGSTAITTSISNTTVTSKLLTGYVSGVGTISATDSILSSIQKLNGNIAALVTGVSSVFSRTGDIVATSGDYNTSQVTENTNLYFTNVRVNTQVSTYTGDVTLSGTIFAIGNSKVLNSMISSVAWSKITSTPTTLSGYGITDAQSLATNLTSISGLAYVSNSFVKMTAAGVFSLDTNTYLTGNQTITLSGDVTGSGSTSITTSISNSTVTGKLLTGYISGSGIISATDSILSSIQKLNGNIGSLVTGVSSVFGRTGTVVAVSGDYTTTLVTEGTNLYYTQTRFDTAFSAKTTTNLTEGTNLYFTNLRTINSTLTGYISGAGVISATDTILSAIQKLNGNVAALVTGVSSVNGLTGTVNLTTTNITEGINLYYTQTRFDTAFSAKTTTNLTEGTNLYFTNARAISSILTGYISGAGIISATDSILSSIQKLNGNIGSLVTGVSSVFGRTGSILAVSGDYTTTLVTEGTNLYFTNARAISSTLTGYISGAGVISATDTILSSIQKLNGNISTLVTGVSSVNGLTGSVSLTGTLNRITISAANVFDISSSYIGQSSITTLGTITSGVWNGTLIGTIYGGTGTAVTFTKGSIVFAGTGGVYVQDNTNFFYDNTNKRLGIKTNAPVKTLHTAGDVRFEPVSGVVMDVESATVATTNAVLTTLQTIAIPIGTVVLIDARIHSQKNSGTGIGAVGDGNAYIRMVKAKNIGGTVTIGIISSTLTSEDIAAFNATFTVSGTNVNIDVTGSANNNVTWTSSCIITR